MITDSSAWGNDGSIGAGQPDMNFGGSALDLNPSSAMHGLGPLSGQQQREVLRGVYGSQQQGYGGGQLQGFGAGNFGQMQGFGQHPGIGAGNLGALDFSTLIGGQYQQPYSLGYGAQTQTPFCKFHLIDFTFSLTELFCLFAAQNQLYG